jgi:hypothetical protein
MFRFLQSVLVSGVVLLTGIVMAEDHLALTDPEVLEQNLLEMLKPFEEPNQEGQANSSQALCDLLAEGARSPQSRKVLREGLKKLAVVEKMAAKLRGHLNVEYRQNVVVLLYHVQQLYRLDQLRQDEQGLNMALETLKVGMQDREPLVRSVAVLTAIVFEDGARPLAPQVLNLLQGQNPDKALEVRCAAVVALSALKVRPSVFGKATADVLAKLSASEASGENLSLVDQVLNAVCKTITMYNDRQVYGEAGPALTQSIIVLLSSPLGDDTTTLAKGLRALGSLDLSGLKSVPEPLIGRLQGALQNPKDDGLANDALETCLALRGKALPLLPRLLELAECDEEFVAADALMAVSGIAEAAGDGLTKEQGVQTVGLFARALKRPDPNARQKAAWGLIYLGPSQEAVIASHQEVVASALRDESAGVRAVICFAVLSAGYTREQIVAILDAAIEAEMAGPASPEALRSMRWARHVGQKYGQ